MCNDTRDMTCVMTHVVRYAHTCALCQRPKLSKPCSLLSSPEVPGTGQCGARAPLETHLSFLNCNKAC